MANIDGTAAGETLVGTSGDDVILGGGGSDRIDGGPGGDGLTGGDESDRIDGESGDDLVDGGGGDDILRGGAGDDLVHGGDGDDYLFSDEPGSDQLHGDAGDDFIEIHRHSAGSTLSVFGGSGSDTIHVGALAKGNMLTIDAGDGIDWIYLPTLLASPILTLGAGRDFIDGSGAGLGGFPDTGVAARVTDWEAGPAGDVLDVAGLLRATGWNPATNPFTAGYLSLIQLGDDVQLSFSATANGAFREIFVFENVAVGDFTSENFGGYSHEGSVDGAEHVVGTDAALELLTGGSGDDFVEGGGGRDLVWGGAGDDAISGEDGDDRVDGGAGHDEIDGGEGMDVLRGGAGDDLLSGGAGNDRIEDQSGNDSVDGGDGDDNILLQRVSGSAASLLFASGGEGDDSININAYNASTATVDAGAGNDIVSVNGSFVSQTVTLGAGSDLISYFMSNSAPTGTTTVTDFETGAGGDRLRFSTPFSILGHDPVASGFLRLVQNGSSVLFQYDLDASSPNFFWRTLITLENTAVEDFTAYNLNGFPVGGPAPDGLVVAGTGGDDRLHGDGGADLIGGQEGNDFLLGLGGDDEMDGGTGDDRLEGGAGQNHLLGGEGNDILVGGDGSDLLEGGEGADSFVAGGADDLIFGGGGNDSFTVSDSGNDVIHGDGGDDSITLLRYNDSSETISITGDEGADSIRIAVRSGTIVNVDGGIGDDRVILDGGTANRITLGDGRDVVELDSGFAAGGASLVADFEAGDEGDSIDFSRWLAGFAATLDPNANPFLTGTMRLVQNGADVLLQLDRDGPAGGYGWSTLLTLQNVDMSSLRPANLDNYQLLFHHGTGEADTLEGSAFADILHGEGGDDTILGFAGADQLHGGEGADRLDGGSEADSLDGGSGDDELTGGEGDDLLLGEEGDDALAGGAGADQIDGGAGHDSLDGGEGGDSLYYQPFGAAPDHDLADGGAGQDALIAEFSGIPDAAGIVMTLSGDAATGYSGTIASGADHKIAFSGVEAFLIGGTAADDNVTTGDFADIVILDSGNDVIVAGGGADWLIGGAGADRMTGGTGNDRYDVDDPGDVVVEKANEGIDLVETSLASYALLADFENLTGFVASGQILTGNDVANTIRAGSGNDQLNGGLGADVLWGGNGNDELNGGLGNDTMRGEQGDDVYTVDSASDSLIEIAGEGTDKVLTALVSYTLVANVEKLAGTLSVGQTLRANALDNVVDGSAGGDSIRLQDGGADKVFGNGGGDIIYFGAAMTAADQADGGAGSDTLTLQGSYSAGLTFNAGALVEIETLHLLSRTDTLYGGSSLSPFSYNLTTVDANVAAGALLTVDASGLAATEGLDFNGKAELDGRFAVTGGLAGDTLYGGAGADSLSGGGGSDRLDGGAGADTLGGGSGDDQIDGGAGADTMTGGSGNDLYIVDNGGDIILESPGAGTDEIRTALASYTVAPNIEVLRGTSAAGQQLTGGSAGLAIFGAAGSDLLDDGGGAAAMQGGKGDDVYVVRAAGTTATETAGEGTDIVRSYTSTFSLFTGVEILVGMLSTGQTLIGHSGDDIITAGAGADRLDGAGGADLLTGGLGGDFYVVDTLADTVVEAAGEGIDTIETALAAFTLIANVENLTARTNSGQALTGNDAANVITAGAGNDLLIGLGGNDRLIGGGGSDTITYAGSAVGIVATVGPFYSGTVTVGAGETDSFDSIETVVGTDFADTFVNNSTVPASVMTFTGGAGDDVYRLGSTAGVIIELAGGGTDHVFTSASAYALGANLENLTGTSTESQSLFGNALDNVITGGSAANTLRLEAGGADRADGGEGNDTIVFGASFGAGDSAEGGSGTDVLRLQGSYAGLSLGANVSGIETLELYGGAAASPNSYQIASQGLVAPAGAFKVDGTRLQAAESLAFDGSAESGVAFNLLGGAGNDLLKGGGLADTLDGGLGADSLAGGGGDDLIDGGGGADHIDDSAGGSNVLRGGDGDDLIDFEGVGGGWTLEIDGGGGDDRALFHAAGAGTAAIDMGAGNDRVVIEHLAGGSARVTLGAGQDVLAVERVPFEQAGQGLGALVVADFETGASGDRFEWPADLAQALVGWTAGGNPFATGHARLVQSGAHTLLQVSRSANGIFATIATFENRAAADFTGDNFGGWSPLPVTGGSGADQIAGTASSDYLFGGGGNDVFHLGGGGDDLADGGTGNDVFYFGDALSPGDVATGGDGRDAIVLQGNVTVVLSDANLVGIESISLQSGVNATFGDTANNFYDFDVTTADGNVVAGVQLIVNGQSLRAGEDFTFDGSAETDGRFLVYGGHGVDDLTGGDGVDVFFFEGQRWGAGDRVDGGGGRDSLVISGGDGITRVVFEADSFASIESISLNNHYAIDPTQKPSYELVLHNGNVAAGATLIVNGSSIATATQFVSIDGSAVQGGKLILYSGAGNDALTGGEGNDILFAGAGADDLTGGAGADTFRYDLAADSTAGSRDEILDFQSGADKIDLGRIDANIAAAGNQAFSWIGSNAFTNVAGQLRAFQSGGQWIVEGDTNGDGNADLVITVAGATPLTGADFLL